ncbi:hypothetical protein GMORB2_3935 [Geosmithia morbida]|uniref:Peroxisomal membrane protein PEX13 n=1 Tax=Geosmithia morbida TaxID=1094350 RepID=A0A9P4Z0C9_9HYPO|nr:uncharacterized protein GMORB2_3935 [Geosmithia morbida]KAF4125096.1 hypothetical protein GMORB2_3935 [Geosmithia morbida]
MASPPKPWERAGAGAATATATPVASTTTATPSTTATSSAAPPVPEKPSSLASAANQNTSNYSRMGGSPMGASPYGGGYGGAYGGSAYSSPYSSPYSRFGNGMMGGGMYGGGMYGGGMMGGGMYGGMPGGMMGNDPNSLTNRFSNSTAATFQMLEGIVATFGGFSQMLESTYMATHSSFFAMVSVAEQFSNLRDTLGSLLGIFTLMRWIRTLVAKITGRPPPADAMALTPAAFARFEGRGSSAAGAGPPRASRKPLFFFILAAFGLPYLMSKAIKSLAASHEEEEKRLQQQQMAMQQQQQQTLDPSKLEFCRLLYDFIPQPNTGVELEARKGDLVAVLSKNDPLGNPSDWWQCRSRDGRQGYLPSTYLEVLRRPGGVGAKADVKAIKATPASESSRANSLTSASEASDPKKELVHATVDGMQRSHFYS